MLLRRKGERNQFSVVMQLVYFSIPLRSAGCNVFGRCKREGEREGELQEQKEDKTVRQASKFCHCLLVHVSSIPMANSMPAKLHGLPKNYSA